MSTPTRTFSRYTVVMHLGRGRKRFDSSWHVGSRGVSFRDQIHIPLPRKISHLGREPGEGYKKVLINSLKNLR